MPNPPKPFSVIAMDGGAAVGKSSTARAVAERLNLMHVDTGAHYRTLTAALLHAGVSPDDGDLVDRLNTMRLGTQCEGRSARLSVDGETPADASLRSPQVNAAVSSFAAVPAVRQALFDYQRAQAEVAREAGFSGLIMEGRDIGSVIFPNAPYRFFLEADEATRSARRAKEGQTDSIADRDKQDMGRKTAPLVCPEGATRIDTSTRSLHEVVDHVIALIHAGQAPV
jgi:cytidylate kinase